MPEIVKIRNFLTDYYLHEFSKLFFTLRKSPKSGMPLNPSIPLNPKKG